MIGPRLAGWLTVPDDLPGDFPRTRWRAPDGRVVHPLPVGRATVVLVVFVAVTVVLLGKADVGPVPAGSSSPVGASSAPAVTTHPSTTTTVPSTTTTTIPPSSVDVLVANGSQVNGLAGRTTATLKSAGWGTLPAVNATAQVTKTMVYYLAGFEPSAAAVAAALQLPSDAVAPYTGGVPVGTIGSAKVVVVAGPDLASAASTTTTTPATSTTSRRG